MKLLFSCLGILFLLSCQAQPQISGFAPSSDSYDVALIDSLRSAVEAKHFKRLNSLIVLKNGELLIEEYYNGTRRHQVHDVRSVGKTFASAVLGIALEEGHLQSLDQPLSDFYDLKQYDHYHPQKAEIRIRDLLTMSSNFDGNDNDYNSPGNEGNMYSQENWVEWTLNVPIDSSRKAGEEWNYFTAGIVLLGDIIHQNVPVGLEEYADEKLFQPLGIRRYYWPYTPQRVASTAGGIRLTPLGFAKFGQLYLQKGQWNGRQILPEKWVEESFTSRISTTIPPNEYGYLWWIKPYEIDGTSYTTHYCTGNGGNKIFVFQELDMVVVVTASAYNTNYGHRQVDEMMINYVLPAVLNP
jgi:CubicO group peptidase (beta-lactamase class C family)